jgi:hypothetical protein
MNKIFIFLDKSGSGRKGADKLLKKIIYDPIYGQFGLNKKEVK